MALVNRRVLPGFSLSLGYTVFYLTVLVLVPIVACISKASTLTLDQFWAAVWTERTRAASLGASRWQAFRRVILPPLYPALLTGFALAFARSLGEYGSVVFVSGNMPYKTEIAPVLIVARLQEYAYGEATAIAVVLLAVSFAMLVLINLLERWSKGESAHA